MFRETEEPANNREALRVAEQGLQWQGVIAFCGKAGIDNGVMVNTGNAAAGAMGD
jgi:hypothetical protein